MKWRNVVLLQQRKASFLLPFVCPSGINHIYGLRPKIVPCILSRPLWFHFAKSSSPVKEPQKKNKFCVNLSLFAVLLLLSRVRFPERKIKGNWDDDESVNGFSLDPILRWIFYDDRHPSFLCISIWRRDVEKILSSWIQLKRIIFKPLEMSCGIIKKSSSRTSCWTHVFTWFCGTRNALIVSLFLGERKIYFKQFILFQSVVCHVCYLFTSSTIHCNSTQRSNAFWIKFK